MRTNNLLFDHLPTDGNGPDLGSQPPPAAQPPPTIPAANQPAPPPPPAAAIVSAGKKTESDVAPDLDAKKLQTRIAQLEDEKRQLLQSQSTAPTPVVAQQQKKSWLEGGSFFD